MFCRRGGPVATMGSMCPAPQRRRFRWLGLTLLLVSTVVALGIAAAVGLFFMDDLVRYTFMQRLCSDDPQKQETGVGYVIRHIDDEQVMRGARRVLVEADEACFEAVVTLLDELGAWGPRFGVAYLRDLERRLDDAPPRERAAIAVTLAQLAFDQRPGHDHPRLRALVDRLLGDDDALVRYNALTAAAALPVGAARQRVAALTDDPEERVSQRARRMLAPTGGEPAEIDLDDLPEPLRRLAELELTADASVDGQPALERDTPPLIRLHLVRVHREAEATDLLPVFREEQATLRDVATIVALQRFDRAALKPLARALIASYAEPQRRAGVLLAAMAAPDDDELREMLHVRFDNATGWVSKQHYRLALHLIGELEESFDAATLLLHRDMPRTTVVMAMLHRGDLRGLDWLLAPVGEPGVGSVETLVTLMDLGRYHVVVAHYLPDAPAFDPWAEADQKRAQVEALRDWYLLHRHDLTFDAAARRFRPPGGE